MERNKKVITDDNNMEYIDLDETKMYFDEDLFDDEDDYYVEPFGWED